MRSFNKMMMRTLGICLHGLLGLSLLGCGVGSIDSSGNDAISDAVECESPPCYNVYLPIVMGPEARPYMVETFDGEQQQFVDMDGAAGTYDSQADLCETRQNDQEYCAIGSWRAFKDTDVLREGYLWVSNSVQTISLIEGRLALEYDLQGKNVDNLPLSAVFQFWPNAHAVYCENVNGYFGIMSVNKDGSMVPVIDFEDDQGPQSKDGFVKASSVLPPGTAKIRIVLEQNLIFGDTVPAHCQDPNNLEPQTLFLSELTIGSPKNTSFCTDSRCNGTEDKWNCPMDCESDEVSGAIFQESFIGPSNMVYDIGTCGDSCDATMPALFGVFDAGWNTWIDGDLSWMSLLRLEMDQNQQIIKAGNGSFGLEKAITAPAGMSLYLDHSFYCGKDFTQGATAWYEIIGVDAADQEHIIFKDGDTSDNPNLCQNFAKRTDSWTLAFDLKKIKIKVGRLSDKKVESARVMIDSLRIDN